MKLHLTSRYHPEGDRQTECVNQTLEQYIQIFTNYQQDNWSSLLPLAEFSYNNAPHTTTGVSPFFANKGYDPTITIHLEYELASSRAHKFITDLSKLHDELRKAILLSQEHYQCSADKNRIPPLDFKVGDRVFIKAKFFRTTCPTKKFSEKYLSPYEIIDQAGPLSWTLHLPDSMHVIHPIFHVSMLEPSTLDSIPDHTQPPPPPILIDGDPEYLCYIIFLGDGSRPGLLLLISVRVPIIFPHHHFLCNLLHVHLLLLLLSLLRLLLFLLPFTLLCHSLLNFPL